MARLNGAVQSKKQSEASIQTPTETPPTQIASSKKSGGILDTARRLLWKPASAEDGAPREDESADEAPNDSHNKGEENGFEDVAQEESDGFQAVEEPTLPLAIEIQIPARAEKRKRVETHSDDQGEETSAERGKGRPKGSMASRKDTPDAKVGNSKPSTSPRYMTRRTATVPEVDVRRKHLASKKISKDKDVLADHKEAAIDLAEHALLPPEAHDGNTGLYESPTPAKVQPIHPSAGNVTKHAVRANSGSATSSNQSSRPVSRSSRDEKISLEEETSEDEKAEDEESDGESPPQLDSNPIVDFDHFQKMLTIAKRVGHAYLKAGGEGRLLLRDVDKVYQTNAGKRVVKALRKMNEVYESLRSLCNDDDYNNNLEEARSKLIDRSMAVYGKVHELINTRFKIGTPLDYDTPGRTKNILRDIYFIIVPQYVELLVLIARVDPLQESMDAIALDQFHGLAENFSTLIHGACEIPLSHQPQTKDLKGNYGTKTFEISKPTTQLKPMIRYVEKKLKQELLRRHRVARQASLDERRQAEEQDRDELEQKQALERRRKATEADRRIKEALANHPMYDHPLFGPALRKKDGEEREKARPLQIGQRSYSRSQSSSTSSHQQNGLVGQSSRKPAGQEDAHIEGQELDHEDEQDQNDNQLQNPNSSSPHQEEDPFASDTEERVRGVFGYNNSNHTSTAFTREQYSSFIAIIREDTSDDRYSRAAKELQLSMDEIFSLARDVQIAFDNCHENGDLMEAGDAWTYDVWMEPGAVE